MYKKFLIIAPIIVLGMENNNNFQIPAAPSIIAFYTKEIKRFNKYLLMRQPPIEEWEKFRVEYDVLSGLYFERETLQNKGWDFVFRLGKISHKQSEDGKMRPNFEFDNQKANNPLNSDFAKTLANQIHELDLRMEYEAKREYVRFLSSQLPKHYK